MLEALTYYLPMRIDVDTYVIYIVNPDASDDLIPNSKFCINARTALKCGNLVYSLRFREGGNNHNICIVKLNDGDFIHFVYNIQGNAQHFWGKYENHKFVSTGREEYKKHKERFHSVSNRKVEITGDISSYVEKNDEARAKNLFSMLKQSIENKPGLDESLVVAHGFDGDKSITVKYDKGV